MKYSLGALLICGLVAAFLPAAQDDGPKKIKPTNLAVNTKADEDDPHLSADGLTLFYAAGPSSKEFHLMKSDRRAKNQAWPEGKPLDDLNSNAEERSPCLLTSNGKYPHFFFFATKKNGKGDNFDLYFAVKQGPQADYTSATPVQLACTEADELHPWVTSNGRELYFSRKTKEGWHVFVSPRPDGTGAFEKPRLVDLPGDFHHATLSPDGLTMYLQGPLEKDRWGLFRSSRGSIKAEWGKPEPLEELNCEEAPTGDKSPCLSRDGTLLYFASDRPGGKGGLDLWVMPTNRLSKKDR